MVCKEPAIRKLAVLPTSKQCTCFPSIMAYLSCLVHINNVVYPRNVSEAEGRSCGSVGRSNS